MVLISHQYFVFNNRGEIKTAEEVTFSVVSDLKHSDYTTSFVGEYQQQKYKVTTKLNKKINYKTKVRGVVKESNLISNRWLNPSSFDSKKFYLSKKIFNQIKLDQVQVITNNNLITKLRSYRYEQINNKFKSKEIYNALVFGDKDFNDENYAVFQATGIIHIFSVSGLHVIFLFTLINVVCLLLKLTNNITKKINLFLTCIYFFLAGENIPILRSVICKNINNFFNIDKIKVLNSLIIFLLVINPFLIYNLGFVLSFFITYTLLLVKDKSELPISCFLFLIGLPLIINTTYQLNILTPLINLVIVPIITFILLPLCWLLYLTKLNMIDHLISNIYDSILTGLEVVNYFTITIGYVNILILSLLAYFIYQLIISKRIKYLTYLLLVLVFNPSNIDNNFISFIDVNQGDSILVSTNFKKNNILIDTGNTDSEEEVTKFLRYQGINKIDCLIITHFDNDHCANLNRLKKVFKINKIISCDQNKEFNYQQIKEDISFNFGNFRFSLISPKKVYDKANNNSTVILLQINKTKILLTGDIEEEREEELLNNKLIRNIDYLKVAHHGSKTSSSEQFLDLVKPKIAIISCGKNNIYKHPHPDVVKRLESKRIKILQTNIEGNILISDFN